MRVDIRGTGRIGELVGEVIAAEDALLERVEQELRADARTQAYLWVLHGNTRAIGFYEAHGWTADGGEKFGEGGSVQGLRELRHLRSLRDAD